MAHRARPRRARWHHLLEPLEAQPPGRQDAPVPIFRRFGPDDLPAAFAHVVKHEAARRRHEEARADMVEIACAGCGRTQRVRACKVVPADGYTCGLGCCTRNPDFHLPRTPEGCVCVQELYAAGGFSGWTIRPATLEERAASRGPGPSAPREWRTSSGPMADCC